MLGLEFGGVLGASGDAGWELVSFKLAVWFVNCTQLCSCCYSIDLHCRFGGSLFILTTINLVMAISTSYSIVVDPQSYNRPDRGDMIEGYMHMAELEYA